MLEIFILFPATKHFTIIARACPILECRKKCRLIFTVFVVSLSKVSASFDFTVTCSLSNFLIAKAEVHAVFSCPVTKSHIMLWKNRQRSVVNCHKAGLCQTFVASHLVHLAHKLRIDPLCEGKKNAKITGCNASAAC